MKNELHIKILDIELQNLHFKKIEKNVEFEKNMNINFDINGDIVDFLCSFFLRMSEIEIKGEYLYKVSIENPDGIALERFVNKEKFDIAFPVLNKISGLVAKITDEVNTFPFVVPSHYWLDDEEDSEV